MFLDCICGSTTGGLGLLGLYINENNVSLINQTLETLTEYCQVSIQSGILCKLLNVIVFARDTCVYNMDKEVLNFLIQGLHKMTTALNGPTFYENIYFNFIKI